MATKKILSDSEWNAKNSVAIAGNDYDSISTEMNAIMAKNATTERIDYIPTNVENRKKLLFAIAGNISTLLNDHFRLYDHRDILNVISANYHDLIFIVNSKKSIAEREKELRENKRQISAMENDLEINFSTLDYK